MHVSKNWIKRNFSFLNKAFFNGSLPTPRFIVNHSTDYLGQCSYDYDTDIFGRQVNSMCYYIKLSNNYQRNEGDFLNTLLHEMIHLYFFDRGEMDVDHGPAFQQMGRSFDKYGFNIQTCSEICTDLHPYIMYLSDSSLSARAFMWACRLTLIWLAWKLGQNEDAIKTLFFFMKEAAEASWTSLCNLWVDYDMTARCIELLHLIGESFHDIIELIIHCIS